MNHSTNPSALKPIITITIIIIITSESAQARIYINSNFLSVWIIFR